MRKLFLATAALAATGLSSPRAAIAAGLPPILSSEFDSADVQNDIFYLGTNDSLYQLTFGASGGKWAALTGVNGAPPIAAATGIDVHANTIYGENEVHYLTTVGGNLHVEQLYGTNFSSADLTAIASGVSAALDSNLTGYIDSLAGSDNVFFLGTDRRVHLLTWMPSPGWSEDASLDSTSISPSALKGLISGHATSNSDEIFYLGANHHVYEVWRWSQNFDGWHPADVTIANGEKPIAAAASPLTGFFDSTSGNDAMFYLGSNYHVYELLFTTSAVWESVDLTAGSGAPASAKGRALVAHTNTLSGSEEVFFLDAGQNVHILWSWSSPQKFDGWHTYNVSSAAGGAPLAATNSPLSTDVNTIDGSDDVYYLAADKNVHELNYLESSGVWSAKDLNTQTSPVAPKAIP